MVELAAEIDAVARLHGEFRLRSGAVSDTYFDKYAFEADPVMLVRIATAMAELVPDEIDALAGLELGGIPLATMLSQVTGLPARFVRKQAKPYGTARLAEGGPIRGLKLLVVEDVVTSGGQIVASTSDLRERGAVIEQAVCVLDRQAGGREALAQSGIGLRPLLTAADLDAAASG